MKGKFYYSMTWRFPHGEWVSCSEITLERGAQVILNQVLAPEMVEDLTVEVLPNEYVPGNLGQYKPPYDVEARFVVDGDRQCSVIFHVWEVPGITPDPTYLALHTQYIRSK